MIHEEINCEFCHVIKISGISSARSASIAGQAAGPAESGFSECGRKGAERPVDRASVPQAPP